MWKKIKAWLVRHGFIEESPYDHIRTSDYPHVHFAGWTGLPYTTKKEILEGPGGEELKRKLKRFNTWLREQKRMEAERKKSEPRRCPRCGWPLESPS